MTPTYAQAEAKLAVTLEVHSGLQCCLYSWLDELPLYSTAANDCIAVWTKVSLLMFLLERKGLK